MSNSIEMSTDEEVGIEKPPAMAKDDVQSRQEASGILSRLCQIEANLDVKFGIESEAIDRKLPEDRRPVRWHEELSMALLWASATMNTSVSDFHSQPSSWAGLRAQKSHCIIS